MSSSPNRPEFRQIDKELFETQKKATQTEFLAAIEALYSAAEKDIHQQWEKIVQNAVTVLLESSDHTAVH